MMGNVRPPYWTSERLELLRLVLNRVAQRDDQGAYFGAVSLSGLVMRHGPKMGLHVTSTVANHGLTILVSLGILGPGRQGYQPLSSGYRRRYYHQKPAITEDALALLRAQVRQRRIERESKQ